MYVEYSGNAPMISVNYERNLWQKNLINLYSRIGIGIDNIKFREGNVIVPSIPFEFASSFGKLKHFIEIGIGITPFLSKFEMWSSQGYNYNAPINTADYELYFILTPRIGYRFETKKGWLIRAAYTPILYNSSNTSDNYQTNFGFSFEKLF